MCPVGGTIATLEFEIPCAGGLVEPVTYFVVTSDRFIATVFVSGIGTQTYDTFSSFCAPGITKTTELTLVGTFVDSSNFIDIGAR